MFRNLTFLFFLVLVALAVIFTASAQAQESGYPTIGRECIDGQMHVVKRLSADGRITHAEPEFNIVFDPETKKIKQVPVLCPTVPGQKN
ncbi:hypothetical protein [Desulfovibrio ferrophilus]|uniref:Isochorismatase hydrolase n=1 Tax=Desulfovibrio ferrophilus TaxID=241368 RepID=A0A2Z6B3S1_9BACT|nr:hypothetical protein [Desulfovibrio ferrophilus]BBD10131.1 isochorismatase hydrolase [Desulfovibrio ferrophilus]